jgi:SAM-dependent methyltransferase
MDIDTIPDDPAAARDATEAERYWEARYADAPRMWSGRVNPVMAEVVAPLPPGRALDLGCGEGGDAVWLAGRGWRVTAVDISATALRRALEHATEAGVADRVSARRHELGVDFPDGEFDLVSAQFLQSPVELRREEVLRAAARAVAPGGLLLIVEHGALPPWSSHEHHDAVFHTPEETLAGLALGPGWRVERADAPQREADGPHGHTGVLVDHVLAVRRDRAG